MPGEQRDNQLRQHRTIRQEPEARDFPSAESLENRGILGAFPVFQTARMGEKSRHPAADAIARCCLRYIGNPKDRVSSVALCAHLFPGGFVPDGGGKGAYLDYATMLIGQMEKENGIQVLIPGEIVEWDILSYIRDAVALGKARACMNIGHFNLEELGMRYTADWLKTLLDDQVPVTYVPTGDIYRYE